MPQLVYEVCSYLKENGSLLDSDAKWKDQMDLYFNSLRNISRNVRLDALSRARILEVIEMRAGDWTLTNTIADYYQKKFVELEMNEITSQFNFELKNSSSGVFNPNSPMQYSSEVLIKPSGKFPKPTKVPGKTFLRDEVVIRNADSGKGKSLHRFLENFHDDFQKFSLVFESYGH